MHCAGKKAKTFAPYLAGKGFVLLTGEVGTGKTTLLHALLSQLDSGKGLVAFALCEVTGEWTTDSVAGPLGGDGLGDHACCHCSG